MADKIIQFRCPAVLAEALELHAQFLGTDTERAIIEILSSALHDPLSSTGDVSTQLSQSEKEALLEEIHHRVKNNLQIIASLLRLQANRCEHNEEARNLLLASQSRVESMALIHESLYNSDDCSSVNFSQYMQKLAAHLFRIYKIEPTTISFQVYGNQELSLELARAIPCGLIVNELITNAIKHGFPKRQAGEIFAALETTLGNQLILKVGNTGRSLPPEFELQGGQSMGLKLVTGLVKQLKGTLEIEHREALVFKIQFPASPIST